MQLYDLKVNHLTNPIGFRMPRCVFSWKVKDSKGITQRMAGVKIASDEKMENEIFDSGYSSKISGLGYKAEIDLKPYRRYYWTPTVFSDAGEECTGEVQYFETAKMNDPWVGKWITCDSTEKRHPYFEKKIVPKKEVVKARLYICGLGLYEIYVNGERFGEEYLTPYSNDYNEWVQYQTFDMTDVFSSGKEEKLSILLGNGWYKSRFGFAAWDDVGFYGDEWKLIAELRLTYIDGTEEVIGTDDSWTVRRSKIVFSNLYDGEHVDLTLPEMPAEKPTYCEAPRGELTERLSLPVTIHETFDPVELIRTPKDELVFDMGQEFTGIFALKVHEPAGTIIHIQTGEILQKGCFYNENLRSAKSEYFFTTDGTEQVIIPHFTFFGYRYVKIEGVADLKKEDFKGMAYYSDLEMIGNVTTGHEKVNKLISNIRWGLKDNFVDVPTDCPQRDERMGWTGDAQVFSPTALYLTDAYAFYTKYLYDMKKEQKALGGRIPDVVPSVGVTTTASVWGDSCCIIPWNMYLFYGDTSILEDQYESMKDWVDYCTKIDGDDHNWSKVFQYGDWLSLDNPVGGAEQVMGGTDEAYIANIYYAQSTEITAKAAALLGKEEDAKKYAVLSERIYGYVKDEYFSKSGRCCINTQTGLLLALKYHLSDNTELLKEQLTRLFHDTKGKLRTGFVGTPILNNVLSDHGFDQLAYELLLNEEFPGWLREINLGATTVWERWNSLLDDGTISGIDMNSMNHYAYGSILEWIFRHAAGINTISTAPGVTEVEFIPTYNLDLGYVDASYDSPSGTYEIHWKVLDHTHVHLSVTIPFGCKGQLHLPGVSEERLLDPEFIGENPMFADVKKGVCYLTAGSYEITYELSNTLKEVYDLDTPIWKLLEHPVIGKQLGEWVSFIAVPKQFQLYSVKTLAHKYPEKVKTDRLDELTTFLREAAV